MSAEDIRDAEGIGPQKPRIIVHGSVVDFGDVRFGIEVYSDYQSSYIATIDSEGLTEEEKQRKIVDAMPWIDRVLDYDDLGSWGNATFKPEGMELIDEVVERGIGTGFWTFPPGGRFRDDAILPEHYREGRVPIEYPGMSIIDDPDWS